MRVKPQRPNRMMVKLYSWPKSKATKMLQANMTCISLYFDPCNRQGWWLTIRLYLGFKEKDRNKQMALLVDLVAKRKRQMTRLGFSVSEEPKRFEEPENNMSVFICFARPCVDIPKEVEAIELLRKICRALGIAMGNKFSVEKNYEVK